MSRLGDGDFCWSGKENRYFKFGQLDSIGETGPHTLLKNVDGFSRENSCSPTGLELVGNGPFLVSTSTHIKDLAG